MRKRLFIYSTLILSAGLVCFFIASVFITQNNNLTIAKDTVTEMARIYAGLYSDELDIASFAKTDGNTRITVISSDGAVLADNRPLDIGALENHLARLEIQAAANDFPAAYVRYSESLGVDMIYYALKAESGGGYVFVRTAIPVASADAYLFRSLPPLILVLCAVILLCVVLSRVMIKRITRSLESVKQKLHTLSSGEYISGTLAVSYEEIDAIIQEIDDVARILQRGLTELRDEKNKAEYILNNISDGIFAVDNDKNIALINNSALSLFDVTPDIVGKGINYLSYDKALAGAVDDCMKHEQNALFELAFNGRIYLITVKKLPGSAIAMTVMSDVTDNRENAKQREEFFANASHELKTPLTAIKGFNELMSINNKDENINKYIESITRETDRMLALISDMLKLSELENTRSITPAPVSVKKIADEVRDMLSAAIQEKSITFEIIGDGLVYAEPSHVYEIVKNLAENAVRYGNQGGKVGISIESENSNTRLLVYDDGVGISPEEQTRIFERFYRAEKSRSQRNGGTGLGLSIVKHICALYGWKLLLKSKLGVDTEVTVVFNVSLRE